MMIGKEVRIALVAYPGVQHAAVLGLRDLLETASGLQTSDRILELSIIENYSDHDKFDAVILPPCLGPRLMGKSLADVSTWVARQHSQGALICSTCAGAFPLAETGLLDGRKATTHWALASTFSLAYPQVLLQTDRLLIDDGDIITAGGLMAWADLGLRLIARFLGLSVMLETSRFFLIDPGVREQSYYNMFVPDLSHGDTSILKVQHWLQKKYQEVIGIPLMARTAKLEERTFQRRFYKATGLKPSEYLQHLRIAKARELLELTKANIETVAMEVGYSDVSAFRKLFHRIVGLSPGEYRKRFAPAV